MQSFLRSVQGKTKQTKSIEMIDVNALWNTNGHTVHLVEIIETLKKKSLFFSSSIGRHFDIKYKSCEILTNPLRKRFSINLCSSPFSDQEQQLKDLYIT